MISLPPFLPIKQAHASFLAFFCTVISHYALPRTGLS